MKPRAIIKEVHSKDSYYHAKGLVGRKCMPLRRDKGSEQGYFTGPVKYFSTPKGHYDRQTYFYAVKLEFYKGSLEEVPCN